MFKLHCIYKNGSDSISDIVKFSNGALKGRYSDKPIEDIDGHLMPLSLAASIINDIERKRFIDAGWKEISEDDYYYMMDSLPPLRYVKGKRYSGFLLSEFTKGSYTGLFVKCDGRFFCCTANSNNPDIMLNILINYI